MRKILLFIFALFFLTASLVYKTSAPAFAQSCTYCPAREGYDDPVRATDAICDPLEAECDPPSIAIGDPPPPYCQYVPSDTLSGRKTLYAAPATKNCSPGQTCQFLHPNGCVGTGDPDPNQCDVRPPNCSTPDHSACRGSDPDCSIRYCIDQDDGFAFSQKDASELKSTGRCETRTIPPETNPDDVEAPIITNTPLSQPCAGNNPNGCQQIKTALGTVFTGANNFTRWVLGFVLSISGGIVILIIIISGYRLMTSQGDPEKIKNARDQLTAAIVGLLFIIFSLVILELITKDILGLPGFGN